jgi:hypothetical protein
MCRILSFSILFLCLYGLRPLSAQQNNDTLDYYSLNAEQKAQWNEIDNNWRKNEFQPFLNRQKIRLSCAHCERVTLRVVFQILEEHAHFKILDSKKCGTEFSKKQLKEIELLLMKIKFPEFFNGKIIIMQFGNALKC